MSTRQVDIPTAAGTVDGLISLPGDARGDLPGMIQLTDGAGLRAEHAAISERIAGHGYVVLTPNIFYRTTRPPAFDFEMDFTSERTITRFRELTSPLTPEAMAADGSAYVDFLAAQPGVGSGPMGVVGFCYAGQFALRTAAARSDRIAAAASFHGGSLVTDGAASPHLVLPRVKARLYFGHAVNDRSMSQEAIRILEQALKEWGGVSQSEIYEGAQHGWMVPGHRVYQQQQAERGFAKLVELLDGTLRSPVRA